MKVRIEIDTKTFVRFWLVVIGFAALILGLYVARTALFIVGIALFLALALNGPVCSITKRLPNKNRTLSTALAFVLVILFLGAVCFLVVPPIFQQTMKFVESAPETIRDLSSQWHAFGNFVEEYHIQPQVDQVVVSIKNNVNKWATAFSQNILNGIGSAMSGIAMTILILFLTFLMLVEGPEWMKRVWGLYSNNEKMKRHQKIVHRIYAVVTGYVSGQLSVSAIDGLCAGLTVFLLSMFFGEVPANLALPTIAICFTLSLIPMFGATIAGIIVTILLAMNSIPAGVVFVVYFMIYQQIENNAIAPRIQSKKIELSPLAILTAVTIGLYMFGILGGIISIPIAGSLKVLLEDYLERSRKKRLKQSRTLSRVVKRSIKNT